MNDTVSTSSENFKRPVRSYVLRTGRLTDSQKQAIDTLWATHGITPKKDTILNQENGFGRTTKLHLEIGFGMGTSLVEMAANDPESDFIGIEVHTPGLGNALKLIDEQGISNLKIINHDATEIVRDHIAPQSLDRIQIYFPDPWPKKKHHKRRMIQPAFVELLSTVLKPNGILHLATDWEDYALHMAEVMQASSRYTTLADDNSPYSPRPAFRPMTKFENRGLKLGHGVWDLLYTLNRDA